MLTNYAQKSPWAWSRHGPNKSQGGGKLPTFSLEKPREYGLKYGSWLIYAKNIGFVLWVVSSFLLSTQLSTKFMSVTSPCKHSHHTWDPMRSGKPQLPSSQWLQLQLHGLTSSELGLGLGTSCEPALTYFSFEILFFMFYFWFVGLTWMRVMGFIDLFIMRPLLLALKEWSHMII